MIVNILYNIQIKYFSIIFIMLKHGNCFLLANINNINNTVKQQGGSADNSRLLRFNSCCNYTLSCGLELSQYLFSRLKWMHI